MNDKLKIAIFNYSSKNNLLLENFETTTKNYDIFKRNSYNISPKRHHGDPKRLWPIKQYSAQWHNPSSPAYISNLLLEP